MSSNIQYKFITAATKVAVKGVIKISGAALAIDTSAPSVFNSLFKLLFLYSNYQTFKF